MIAMASSLPVSWPVVCLKKVQVSILDVRRAAQACALVS